MKRVAWSLAVFAAALALSGCAGSSEAPAPREEAPDFALQDTEGRTVALSDFRGVQPVLLYFHMAVG